jgi:hypothetical protein
MLLRNDAVAAKEPCISFWLARTAKRQVKQAWVPTLPGITMPMTPLGEWMVAAGNPSGDYTVKAC